MALGQFTAVPRSIAGNVEQMVSLLETAVADGAQLVCFPELCVPGYSLDPADYAGDFLDAIRDADGRIAAAAREQGVRVMYGSAREEGGHLYNVVVLADPSADAAPTIYAKSHVPTGELSAFTAGKELVVTADGALALACCYDLAFPQLCADLAGAGARALFFPMAWEEQRAFVFEGIVAARAIENVAYVVCVNQSGSFADVHFHGRSRIVDPLGATVLQLGNEACVATADIDLAWVSDLRSSTVRTTYPLLDDRRPGLPVRRGAKRSRTVTLRAGNSE